MTGKGHRLVEMVGAAPDEVSPSLLDSVEAAFCFFLDSEISRVVIQIGGLRFCD